MSGSNRVTEEQDANKTESAEEATEAEAAAKKAAPKRRSTSRRASGANAAKSSAGQTGKGSKAAAGKAPAAKSGTSRRRSSPKKEPEAETPEVEQPQSRPLPRIQIKYREEVAPALIQEFEYTTPMQVPALSKIVLNMGLGEALENNRAIESATRDLTLISGQQPVTTRARKSIAGFKLREGMPIGVMVTLRGRRMYEFFDRLVSSALPRIRDFRGISREAFDGRGNYSLGIREHVIFPEIEYNTIDRIRGLQVVIVTTARTDREGLRLLEELGVPLTRSEADSRAA
jgi:large subunit ribosomal protein L5